MYVICLDIDIEKDIYIPHAFLHDERQILELLYGVVGGRLGSNEVVYLL